MGNGIAPCRAVRGRKCASQRGSAFRLWTAIQSDPNWGSIVSRKALSESAVSTSRLLSVSLPGAQLSAGSEGRHRLLWIDSWAGARHL